MMMLTMIIRYDIDDYDDDDDDVDVCVEKENRWEYEA